MLVAMLCGLLGGASQAWGEEVIWDLTEQSYSSASTDLISWSSDYAIVSAAKNGGTAVNNYCPPTNSQTRLYEKNILKFTPASGYTISSAEVTGTTAGYVSGIKDGTKSNCSTASSDAVVTITPTDGSLEFSITISKTVRLTQIKVNYTSGSSTPVASLAINPSSIEFGDNEINTSKSKTFTVTYANLSQDLNVSVGAGLECVSVSPTTISKDATSPQTVTVTYAPTSEGNINGSITVSNTTDNVSQAVAITGSAYDASNVSFYEKVTANLSDWSGDYIFTGLRDQVYYALTGVSSNLGTVNNVTVDDHGIASTSIIDTYKVTIAPTTNGYSLYLAGVGYLSYSGSSNQLQISNEYSHSTCDWTISFSDGLATITNVGVSTRILQFNYNNGNPRFACYTSNQVKLTLFKLNNGTCSISANNVNIAFDETSGIISYDIINPVSGTTLSASVPEGSWLALGTVGNNSIPFTCSANENSEARTETVTLNYGSVTTTVTVTQAGTPLVYTTIPDLFNAATSTSTTVDVKFDNWVVTGVNGSQVFVTDGTNGFIVYQSNHGFAEGNILSGTASCSLVLFRGSAQLTGLTSTTDGLTVGTGGSVTPVVTTIDALSALNTGSVVTLNNLTYNGSVLTDGTNTIDYYETLYNETTLESGKTYNITGVFVQNNDTKRILPRSADDIEEYVAPKHTVKFFVNGVEQTEAEALVSEGNAIEFPTATATIESKNFVGWTTTEINGETDEAPTIVTTATMGTSDVTFYAVYATQDGGGDSMIATLTSDEIAEQFNSSAMTYAGDEKSYEDISDNITWAAKGYSSKDAPWIQLRKNATAAYLKICAENNISNISFKISNATNATGTSTSEITNHGAFAGSILLLEAPAGNASEADYGSTNTVENYVANIVPTTDVSELYVQVTAAARIWEVNVTYGAPATYSGYCTTIPSETVSVSVGVTGFATFSCDKALDFTGIENIYAYTATVSGKEISFKRVYQVPANTGLLLRNPAEEAATEASVPVIASATLNGENALVAVSKEIASLPSVNTEDNSTNYILNKPSDKNVGFFLAAGNKVGAGKAYLNVPAGASVKSFAEIFGSETDGVEEIENGQLTIDNAVIFNLAGQRLQKLQKGVNIIGGKKVLVK